MYVFLGLYLFGSCCLLDLHTHTHTLSYLTFPPKTSPSFLISPEGLHWVYFSCFLCSNPMQFSLYQHLICNKSCPLHRQHKVRWTQKEKDFFLSFSPSYQSSTTVYLLVPFFSLSMSLSPAVLLNVTPVC